jgi:hypothetical protein
MNYLNAIRACPLFQRAANGGRGLALEGPAVAIAGTLRGAVRWYPVAALPLARTRIQR